MPVETSENLSIVCDNPRCPGNSGLDPNNRAGWIFVSSEVYGDPVQQHVFCSQGCLSATAGADNSPIGRPQGEHPSRLPA